MKFPSTLFQADTPWFIHNFHSFSTAQSNPRADPGESVLVDPGWHWLPTTQTSPPDLQQLFGRAEAGAALSDPGPCSDQAPSTASALF